MARDLLTLLPKLPLGDFFDHLISNDACSKHATSLLDTGVVVGIERDELASALARAWLLYIQGNAITRRISTQRAEMLAREKRGDYPRLKIYKELSAQRRDSAKRRKLVVRGLAKVKGRPPQYGDHAFIQAMREIWVMGSVAGTTGWTAFDGVRELRVDGPFQRFVRNWLSAVDPQRHGIPSQHIFNYVKQQMQKSRP